MRLSLSRQKKDAMKPVYYSILFLFLILFLFSTACDDTITGDELDKIVIPDKDVSYREYINPVLQAKCAVSGCHDNQTKAGGLDVTTYSALMADPLIVFPGEPQNSKLVWAIEGVSGTERMPPLSAPVYPLNSNQMQGIRTWIKEGAKNN